MRTLKQSTLLIMIFSIITRLMSFFFKIYLSRRVGAEILGLFQMAFSIFGLFSMIAGSGIPLMLSRKTAELTAVKQEKKLNGVMTGAMLLSLGVSLFLIAGAFLLRHKLTFVFSDGRCVKLFYIILPALLSSAMYQLLRGYFMGKGRYFDYSLTELLEEVIKIIACLTFLSNAFIALSDSVAISIAFTITDYSVMIILLLLYFIKGGKIATPVECKPLIRSSLPVTGMRIAAGLITSFIAVFLPAMLVKNGMAPGAAAAEYGRAVGMAFSLLFAPLSLTGALCVVILPEAAALAATGKWKELRTRVNESILFIFIITVLFYALFLVLGETYGELLFKDVRAGRFVAFSSGMVIPAALSGLINTTLNSLGEERKVFFSFLISSLLLILSVLFLPKYIGIYALAVGECAFHVAEFMFGMYFLWKKGGYTGAIFRPAAITMSFSFPTALAAKCAHLFSQSIGCGIIVQAAFATITGIAAYLSCIFLFKPIPGLKAIVLSRRKIRKTKKKDLPKTSPILSDKSS
ncbi:MAG TPA: hypothetical protein DIC18_02160 [Clostridiales bacterium]|nr:hypothetical protein [Clostridiales bacterium]